MPAFDLGAVLMVAGHSLGKSIPTARLDDLSSLVNFMTHRPQVPYDPVVLQTCGEAIVPQHPWIAELDIPDLGLKEDGSANEALVDAWLEELGKKYGVTIEIAPLSEPLERTVMEAVMALRPDPKKIITIDSDRPESFDEAMNIIENDTPDH